MELHVCCDFRNTQGRLHSKRQQQLFGFWYFRGFYWNGIFTGMAHLVNSSLRCVLYIFFCGTKIVPYNIVSTIEQCLFSSQTITNKQTTRRKPWLSLSFVFIYCTFSEKMKMQRVPIEMSFDSGPLGVEAFQFSSSFFILWPISAWLESAPWH